MKQIVFLLMLTSLTSCEVKTTQNESKEPSAEIVGTWELISGRTVENGDTTFTDYRKNQKFIKIINKSHFSFVNHDLHKGKDSAAVFSSGAGKYSLVGTHYTEFLEYCSAREWEDNKFEFEINLKGDTLIQTGIEKVEKINVDRIITETYIRVKE